MGPFIKQNPLLLVRCFPSIFSPFGVSHSLFLTSLKRLLMVTPPWQRRSPPQSTMPYAGERQDATRREMWTPPGGAGWGYKQVRPLHRGLNGHSYLLTYLMHRCLRVLMTFRSTSSHTDLSVLLFWKHLSSLHTSSRRQLEANVDSCCLSVQPLSRVSIYYILCSCIVFVCM